MMRRRLPSCRVRHVARYSHRVRMRHPFIAVCALALVPAAQCAERVCEQSESVVTPSPGGQREASVQHQVCETAAGGVAAAVTVFVGRPGAALQGARVLATAVPRSREEWPRVRWRDDAALEVWVPNLAKVIQPATGHDGVEVTLHYCGDDPEARASVARHEVDMQEWMQAVSRWNEQRKGDPEGAGPRPQRPEEPRPLNRPCRDSDLRS